MEYFHDSYCRDCRPFLVYLAGKRAGLPSKCSPSWKAFLAYLLLMFKFHIVCTFAVQLWFRSDLTNSRDTHTETQRHTHTQNKKTHTHTHTHTHSQATLVGKISGKPVANSRCLQVANAQEVFNSFAGTQ